MALSQQEIQRIHSNRLATPNRKYYGDNGKVYIGLNTGNLQYLQSIDKVPVVNQLLRNIKESKNLQETAENLYDLIPKVKEIEADFGKTANQKLKIFTVEDSDVRPTSKIQASIAYKAPAGKSIDELEMDGIEIKAGNVSFNRFQIIVRGLEGSLHDKFKITYILL